MSISISPVRRAGCCSGAAVKQCSKFFSKLGAPIVKSIATTRKEIVPPYYVIPALLTLGLNIYKPEKKEFDGYTIPIHNKNISARLKNEYTPEEFDNLYKFAESKGVFDYVMNESTGLVKTSFIKTEENPLMADLIWITDTCHNMDLVKNKEPEKCTELFNNITQFYDKQQGVFDNIISNPIVYWHNGLIWAGEQNGVGHCYVTNTKEPHPWYPKTRLESVGNYLQTAADLITTGMSGGRYGYKTAEDVPENVCRSISNCTAYLKAINYPVARSCGAWEEQTFLNSLTSDTSICNEGMRNIMKLMYEETFNPEILKLREKILNTKHGWIFNDRQGLEKVLADGEQRIINTPDFETTCYDNVPPLKVGEEKCVERKYDAAMSFMPQTETLVKGDIIKDSEKKLDLLDELSWAIVRENGAIRYPGDEYLKLDYHKDKSSFSQDFEAEWFLVTEISKGYGAVAKALLAAVESGEKIKEEVLPLLERSMKKETEYINRGYARITSENTIKTNGHQCPAYKVPEAYEAITCLDGKIRYLPGAHPLTWAESSLYSASKMFAENLAKFSK